MLRWHPFNGRFTQKIRFAGVLFLSLWAALNIHVASAQMLFESIGNAELIPDNVVTDIVQDKQGYLWIATAAGVVRYDGYRFKLFEHDISDSSTLGGNFVRSINVFEDGTLWFSTEPGGVSIYHPDSEKFTRLFDNATLQKYPGIASVSQVLKGQDNEIWLSTNAGLFLSTLTGTVIKHYTIQDGLPHNGIRVLLRDNRDGIWVGTRAGLALFDRNSDRFEPFNPSNVDFKKRYIRALFEDDSGQIWIGTNTSGIWRFDPKSNVLQPMLSNQPQNLQSSTVYDIFQAHEGEIWAARFGGIDRISKSEGKWLTRSIHDPSDSYSLANNDIRTLLRDDSGLTWVGGYGGGVQRVLGDRDWVKTLRFSLVKENALTESNVSSVLALKNGHIWAGTRGGGINVVDPSVGVIAGHFPEVGVSGKLQAGWVTAMSELDSGDIWVGVNPGQLYRFNPETAEFLLYGQEQGLTRSNIRALEPASGGGLWIGTNAGLLYWDAEQDQIRPFNLANGQEMRDGINALHEKENGQLLVATGASGVYWVQPGRDYLEPINGQDEQGRNLNTLSILGMLIDSQGKLWLDTPVGLHLAEFSDDGAVLLSNHSAKAGFAGRPMGANLLEDKQGRIWTPSFVFEPESGKMLALQRADGVDIGTSWFRSYTKTAAGLFLFGGSRGLLMVKPEQFSVWQYNPPIVVSELRVDGIETNAGKLVNDGVRLNPGQRSFSIEFAALDLSSPEKNQYRYKLTGYDSAWTLTDATRRVANYSNLWPGDYTLIVQGSNRNGHWSESELQVPVQIRANYWQTPWFIGLCSVLVFLLIYLGFRIRTHWIKARAEALEVLVSERTEELKKAQQDFIEQEKMASLGALVAGVSHEINTPMGIALTAATALNDDSRSLEVKIDENRLKRSDLDKHISKLRSSNEIILSSLDRACSLIASFKQVAVDQTSEQRRDFELKTLLQDIERSLTSIYAKRGHTLKIHCPEGIRLDSFPGAIFQILTNLINNSVIHGFSGKTQGQMEITVEANNETLVLIYKDNGKGMTPEVQKKAFEPFFTTRMGAGGSGLGMHLVYNYVSQVLGGKVKIVSAPAQGFSCKIEVPLVAPVKDE